MRKLMLLFLMAAPLYAAQQNNFRMEVLVDGSIRPEYFTRGLTYIEALKGREYEIRLTNPFGARVAVALAVDGLNSIDARHTDPRSARKWVLDPYETITIRGWQTNDRQARRFYFTNEQSSYGAWLGRTENLGVLSAAFFRERPRYYLEDRKDWPQAQAAPHSPSADAPKESGAKRLQRDEEYAATGIGHSVSHPVTHVQMDLEEAPAAVVTLRYEYRPALVSLGVLPQPAPVNDPLLRRERARGFQDTGYCPAPR